MSLLHYVLTKRGIEVTGEIICQRHYDEMSQPGQAMGPLSDREQAQGYRQTVRPYSGDRPCETCEQDAETVSTPVHALPPEATK